MLNNLPDPRQWPDPHAAAPQSGRLHELAVASLAAPTGREAAQLDALIDALLGTLRATPGCIADALATAPSSQIYRHLWRRLVALESAPNPQSTLEVTVFAFPVIVVAGVSGALAVAPTLTGVLSDTALLAEVLRTHGALSGNVSFALANALVAAHAIDVSHLDAFDRWRTLPDAQESPLRFPALPPAPMALNGEHETVHLRFLLGVALGAPGAKLLDGDGVGRWGMPFAQALSQQLALPGTSVLALPRAPAPPLVALAQGRSAQREVSAQLFATQAIRRMRGSVGEPAAVVSAHLAPGAPMGGELRLSLSSVFDPRDAEGHRCALGPLDRVADVAGMLVDLLQDCRVAQIHVLPGVHADRDPKTGLLLLFKAEALRHAAPLH